MLAGLAGEAGPYRRLLDKLSGLLRAYCRAHLRAPLEAAEALFTPAGAEAAMASRDLERVMAELPARTRSLIRDVKIEGLSTREAAEKHGMSESAVKVAVHRGLKSLGGKYGGSIPDED